MSEPRPHLSIGEVLSLLQDEFPDITISKIRFLESQGLLNPERTPSGYRKFYDQDVEQLRWVLRQQKENFLPLKVIKDRLAAGQLDGPASDSGVLDLAPAERTTAPGPAAAVTPQRTPAIEPRLAVAASAAGPAAAAGRPGPPAPSRAVPPDPAGNGSGPLPAAAASTPPPPRPQPTAAAPQPARPTDRPSASADPALDAPTPSAPAPAASTPATSGSAAGAPPARAAQGAGPPPRPETALGSSASLTSEELCAATGASPRLLADLERYGLVTGRALGPDTVYDDEAMVICRLAATMAEAGIEARHLRMFKVAAEREAGLYEQLTLPKLRAQRAEARQEAVSQVTELSGTAADLHAALLRRALRDTLGPF